MRKKRTSPDLPSRAGIRPNSIFLPPLSAAESCPRVLDFLVARFPAVSLQEWRRRMEQGDVLDSQGIRVPVDAPYRPSTRLYYYRDQTAEMAVPFQEVILFEDEHILVVDKPHFLATQPSGGYLHETLISRLRQRLGSDELEPLHRLDRDTAGLVLVARHPKARDAYHRLFRDQQITKIYQAVATLNPALSFPLTRSSRIGPAAEFYRRQEEAGQTNAVTRIDLLAERAGQGLYQLQPLTGRTHQLRIHMAALGIPILHDPYYPAEQQPMRMPADFSRPLQLLARELAFTDPLTGQPHRFVSSFRLAAAPDGVPNPEISWD